MLLIIASDQDPNARRLVDHAHIFDLKYLQIDASSSDQSALHWRIGEDCLWHGSDKLQPSAAYLRHDVFTKESAFWSQSLVQTVRSYLIFNENIRVLNRRSFLLENNKAANLSRAKSLGFTIPDTTVMAGPPSAMKQLFTGQDVIAKPLEGGDYAAPVDSIDEDTVSYAASFIQERLPGRNLRVFCIGGKVFGFEVQSAELDYRVDPKTKVIPTEVPAEITEKSLALADLNGFDYCALDFRENSAGEWVFLEVNSFPMFVAFDDASANALVDAQLEFLVPGFKG